MTEDLDISEMINVTKFDAAEYINTDEDEIEFLNAALELNDPDAVAPALWVIVKARGMRQEAGGNAVALQHPCHTPDDGASIDLWHRTSAFVRTRYHACGERANQVPGR